MSHNGFLRRQRELFFDPLWNGLTSKERHVFETIVHHAAWKKYKLDDHGILIDILPSQLLTTQRQLTKLCNENKSKDMDDFDKCFIERTLVKLKLYDFLRQEVRHKKSLLTILKWYIFENDEAGSEANLRQTQGKLEAEKKKVNKIKKDNKPPPPTPQSFENGGGNTLSSEDIQKNEMLKKISFLSISQKNLESAKLLSIPQLQIAIEYCLNPVKPIKLHNKYFEWAMSQETAPQPCNSKIKPFNKHTKDRSINGSDYKDAF